MIYLKREKKALNALFVSATCLALRKLVQNRQPITEPNLNFLLVVVGNGSLTTDKKGKSVTCESYLGVYI